MFALPFMLKIMIMAFMLFVNSCNSNNLFIPSIQASASYGFFTSAPELGGFDFLNSSGKCPLLLLL